MPYKTRNPASTRRGKTKRKTGESAMQSLLSGKAKRQLDRISKTRGG